MIWQNMNFVQLLTAMQFQYKIIGMWCHYMLYTILILFELRQCIIGDKPLPEHKANSQLDFVNKCQ